MMEIVIIINILAFLGATIFIIDRGSKEKKMLVQEVTKALSAKSFEEYVEAIPEDGEEEEVQEQDELEDITEVDEKVLIKYLNKENADIKN